MKVVILAGGLGTRISEESHLKPKPMIEIGKYPILVHIMRFYAAQGFNEFIICSGYKQQIIKEYFSNFNIYTNNVTFDFSRSNVLIHDEPKFDWKVTVVDTGLKTLTGGRIKRARKFIGNQPFLLTYGDAVSNVDLKELLESHKKSKCVATITAYNFGQTKGVISLNNNGLVHSFREKKQDDGDLINAGFMVVEPEIFDYIDDDNTIFEDVLDRLSSENKLNAYVHKGFWQCMDTLREKEKLEEMDASGKALWKVRNK